MRCAFLMKLWSFWIGRSPSDHVQGGRPGAFGQVVDLERISCTDRVFGIDDDWNIGPNLENRFQTIVDLWERAHDRSIP